MINSHFSDFGVRGSPIFFINFGKTPKEIEKINRESLTHHVREMRIFLAKKDSIFHLVFWVIWEFRVFFVVII